jgi:WXG100 family type VII secretion target
LGTAASYHGATEEATHMSGSVTVGSQEFQVDLEQFQEAIAAVTADQNAIETDFSQIQSALDQLGDTWQSPAGDTYASLQSSLTSAAKQMLNVLTEIISRMNVTLQTYENAEQVNANNLT